MQVLKNNYFSIHTKNFEKHQFAPIFVYGSGSVKLDENSTHIWPH